MASKNLCRRISNRVQPGGRCHAAVGSYLAESSRVLKRCAWSCKVHFATPVCFCFFLLTSSVPGLLWWGWVLGRRRLNKLPANLGFQKGEVI